VPVRGNDYLVEAPVEAVARYQGSVGMPRQMWDLVLTRTDAITGFPAGRGVILTLFSMMILIISRGSLMRGGRGSCLKRCWRRRGRRCGR
jgi:hypothetical protein